MKHSKGPWRYSNPLSLSGQPTKTFTIYPNTYRPTAICEISAAPRNNKSIEQAEADAKLISLAPTMYEYIKQRADDGDTKAIEIIKSLD